MLIFGLCSTKLAYVFYCVSCAHLEQPAQFLACPISTALQIFGLCTHKTSTAWAARTAYFEHSCAFFLDCALGCQTPSSPRGSGRISPRFPSSSSVWNIALYVKCEYTNKWLFEGSITLFCRKFEFWRVFCANFWGEKMSLCYFSRFLQVCVCAVVRKFKTYVSQSKKE